MSNNHYYRDGHNWVAGLVQAVLTLRSGDTQGAAKTAWAADCILAPLGEEDDPEAFRDFISGAASASENLLRSVGVPIVADGNVPGFFEHSNDATVKHEPPVE